MSDNDLLRKIKQKGALRTMKQKHLLSIHCDNVECSSNKKRKCLFEDDEIIINTEGQCMSADATTSLLEDSEFKQEGDD